MLDTIKMTYSEYENIHETSHLMLKESKSNFGRIFLTKEVALPRFELNVDDKMVLRYSYDKEDNSLFVNIITHSNRHIAFTAVKPWLDETDLGVTFFVKYDFKKDEDQMWWQAKCQEANESPFAVAADLASQFWSINFYLLNVPSVIKEVKEKKEEVYVEKKKGNKRYKTRVVLCKTIYIHAKKPSKTSVKHMIKCLCWGVRGHFRYMKNGKAVWVRPYRKGKDRNNENAYVGKEYAL